eukprot:TRINITY_DN3728_c0_g2_i1.p1 TRINITY_DN3728_c0_g2~~TRINITY_DN3728_c0_g2_i1.p1  ORF type:complete len:594 (+),score=123.88 TRINITY_DN3728_c0_g2_i1:110-1891(+)
MTLAMKVQWAWGHAAGLHDEPLGRLRSISWSETQGLEEVLKILDQSRDRALERSIQVRICVGNGSDASPSNESVLEYADVDAALAGLKELAATKPASNGATEAQEPVAKRPRTNSCIDRSQFIVDGPGSIDDYFKMGELLGRGGFGTVFSATRKGQNGTTTDEEKNRPLAVKRVQKVRTTNIQRFNLEISIMKSLDHPNIIKLYNVFQDNRCIYLVMELCTGGELFDRIVQAKTFSEKRAATVMQQILRAVFYMHHHGVAHRDLKPENFILQTPEPIEKNTLKVIDFGLSSRFEFGELLTEKVGSARYAAPEVLTGKYTELADLWSCGVILYILLCGRPPFYGKTDAQTLAMSRKGVVSFQSQIWSQVSEDAKRFVQALLTLDVKKRPNSEQALNNVWIQGQAPKAEDTVLPSSFIDNLRRFKSHNDLKKAALQIIARQLTEPQIASLRKAFVAMDDNGDGLLTEVELHKGIEVGLGGAGCTVGELKDLVAEVDTDGSGFVDYSEFIAAALDERHYIEEDACWAAFRVFDRDGDGKITLSELKQVLLHDKASTDHPLECTLGAKALEELIRQVDSDGDGQIDFQEFLAMMRAC